MDRLLWDIRNFLQKLQNGQLEIESGQRELHRDIDNLKNSFGLLSKLKENLEDVKVSNERQLGMIKDLKAKLEQLESRREDQRKTPESETGVENLRENTRSSSDGTSVIYARGRDARRSRAIRFRKKAEITSNASAVRKTRSAQKKNEFKEGSEGYSAVSVPNSCCYAARSGLGPNGFGGGSMLQRYLKDSAKYRGRRAVEESREGRGRAAGRASHFCVACRKVFGNKDLLKAHEEFHTKARRRPNADECSRCKLARGSPASLSLHSKKCRLIRRSRRSPMTLPSV